MRIADSFAGAPAVDATLDSAANWDDVYVAGAGYEFYGATGGTTIEFRTPGTSSRRTVTKHSATGPRSPDYSVWAEYGGSATTTDRTFYVGLAARIKDGGTNWDGYALIYTNDYSGTNKLGLFRYDNDSPTALSSADADLTAGDTFCLEVTGAGAAVVIKGYKNDVEVVSATDTSGSRITAAGLGGVEGISSGQGDTSDDPLPVLREWRLYETGRRAALTGPLAGAGQIGHALAR